MQTLLALDKQTVSAAVKALKQGKLIVYPTDTAYALGADYLNSQALIDIQKLKGRQQFKPLPLIASDLSQVKKIANLTKPELDLAEQYWPGPLTLLVKPKKELPYELTLDKDLVAIRVPNQAIARQIAAQMNRPIVSTSINVTKQPAIFQPSEIIKLVPRAEELIELIIDGGVLPKVAPSTIAQALNDKIIIHRSGSIKLK
ncbi:MAG: L-threonylcarbamoyladenylate synthase [bacterium]